MIDFLLHWQDVRRRMAQPDTLLWLFDFDGTLAPIARNPAAASMSMKARELLRKLSRRFPHHVGVISGRPMVHLMQKVGIPELIYGGTQGFEMRRPGSRWKHSVSAGRLRRLKGLGRELRHLIRDIPGLRIEEKKWTIAVHFRETKPKDEARTAAKIGHIRNLAARSGFKVQDGLKAIEILSDAHWNKGRVVERLRRMDRPSKVFYAGDDATDETVFRILKRSDISVHVGKGSSRAFYSLKNQRDMVTLLGRILTL